MTYTGLAYSNPIRVIFHLLLRSQTHSTSDGLAAQHREGKMTYTQEILPPFERSLYRPLLSVFRWITTRARIIQTGNVNQYVAYIFLIVLLVLALRAL